MRLDAKLASFKPVVREELRDRPWWAFAHPYPFAIGPGVDGMAVHITDATVT